MSRPAMSASGAPYVLDYYEFDGPGREFADRENDPERPVFSVATPAGQRLDLTQLEQVAPEAEIEWLWPEMVPLRKVTLIEGPAGAGKSQLALDLAARVTRSAPWPDGQPSALPTADVLVVCRKDEAATASVRFERAGGDRTKLFHFREFQTLLTASGDRDTRPIALPYDFPALEHLVEVHENFGMIVIDSLADFCRTPGQVAETLVLLEDLAARANVALVVTLPANCRVDAQGRLRVTSRWPTERLRSAWCLLADPDDPERRLFVAKRTNFCREPEGLAYRLSDRGVAWETRSRISPVDPLGQFRACDLCLAELLRDGELPASTVYRLGGEMGFSPKQLRAAGERLGAASTRIGYSGKGHWSWSLPGARLEVDRPNVGCVEQAQAPVRRRSRERGSYFEGVSPVPEAACADTPQPGASLTHPTRLPGGGHAAGCLEAACVEPAAEGGDEKNGESLGIYGECMGNDSLADAAGGDHVTQAANLLVSSLASSTDCAVQEESESRIARSDDAERRDGRSHAERGNEEFMGTFENGEPVGSSVAGNAREGNRAESRRRRRKMRRNRKKEWRQRLASETPQASATRI